MIKQFWTLYHYCLKLHFLWETRPEIGMFKVQRYRQVSLPEPKLNFRPLLITYSFATIIKNDKITFLSLTTACQLYFGLMNLKTDCIHFIWKLYP